MAQATSNTTPELMVRVVTIDHRSTKIGKHNRPSSSSSTTPNLNSGTSEPSLMVMNPLQMKDLPSPSSLTEAETIEKTDTTIPFRRWYQKPWWCCPGYMIVGLIGLLALAIGIGVNIDKLLITDRSNPTSSIRSLLNLQFNVTHKNVNFTMVTELRCMISNLTDPTYFTDAILTSWTESNGTVIFVDKDHVFNYATNCTDFSGYNFRRRLLFGSTTNNNNPEILPDDPVTLNISAVKPIHDVTKRFVDRIWNSEALMAIAPLITMNENYVVYFSSPSSTPSTTPSNTPTSSPSTTNSMTSTSSPTPSNSPSSSVSVSNTPTGTPTPTSTLSASTTVTASPGASLSSTPTPSPTASLTPTPTSTVTPSNTPSPSPTPTPATVLLEDANPGALSSYAQFYTVFKDAVYFSNFENTHGTELWVTYLSNSSTSMVVDIYPGINGSNPSFIVVYGDNLLFSCNNGIDGNELCRSNGTAIGTSLVKDIVSGSGDSNPSNLIIFQNKVVFTAYDSTAGYELFITDGTDSGTSLITDLYSGLSTGVFSTLFNVNDTFILFTGNNGTSGRELYRTNGTDAGTFLVKDIHSGSSSGNPDNYIMFRGAVYFSADDGIHGIELWVTDGTEANTYMLKDINTGNDSGFFSNYRMVTTMESLYFIGNTSTAGSELWISDGTVSGTVMVMDINAGPSGSISDKLYVFNATSIMFAANDGGVTGNELWISSGTIGTTYLVRDINPGTAGSNPANMGITQLGVMFLSADDGIHGMEIFKSKGTFSSTILVNDIHMGSNGSDIFSPFVVNNTYLCMASNGIDGSELYLSVALPDPSPSPTPTSSPTGTATSTSTPTPTPSPTSTISASTTPSPTGTGTGTPTRTPSTTSTSTGTRTPSPTSSPYALILKSNPLSDWGGGGIEFLDRQDVSCGAGAALKRFYLTHPTYGNIAYFFECYSSSRYGTVTSYSTNSVSIGDFSIRNMANLLVSCPSGSVLNGFKFRHTNFVTIYFTYDCVPLPNMGTCNSVSTVANSDGGPTGTNVFLDRHDVICNAYQVMQGFKIVRPSTSTIQYEYTCCNM